MRLSLATITLPFLSAMSNLAISPRKRSARLEFDPALADVKCVEYEELSQNLLRRIP